MPRLLVFNADDYGLTSGVSGGIRRAMQCGVLRSTTVMANLVSQADLEELNSLLAADAQLSAPLGLSAGCHLNLSCGAPLSRNYPAELLSRAGVGDARFDKSIALSRSTWDDPRRLEGVWREWETQLRLLLDAGLPVSHLDSHHHVHMHPALFPLALELARLNGLALRCRREYCSLARASQVASPDTLVEGYFGAAQVSLASLAELLAAADGEVVEVMCHPGVADASLLAISSYVIERETELEVLCTPGLDAQLSAKDWRLAGYNWWRRTEQKGEDAGC